MTRHVVRSQQRAGRWRTVGTRVVVLHTGPLTVRQRWWVAVLHAGPTAALCWPSGLQADGLRGYEPGQVYVVVPHGTRVPPLDGVRLVEARDLRGVVHPTRPPPRTRTPRAVVDAAVLASDDLRACAIVAATVQQGLVRAADVRAELTRRANLPRRPLLLSVVDDVAGGAHSLGELDALRLCRRFGLPPPSSQVVRRDGTGRRRYLDLHWKRYRVSVEIDGGQHREVSAWWADMDRQNEVVLATDGVVLRFPALALRLFPERVADQIRRALLASGWAA